MVRITKAIFEQGRLIPLEPLALEERQIVSITVDDAPGITPKPDREAAIARFREGIARSRFRSTGPYPTRQELWERRFEP